MEFAPGTTAFSRYPDLPAFIGSLCTNGRGLKISEPQPVCWQGRKIAPHVRGIIVPGSTQVRKQAETKGWREIFADAGFEWRQSVCSMCLAMNEDVLYRGVQHPVLTAIFLADKGRCQNTSDEPCHGRSSRRCRTPWKMQCLCRIPRRKWTSLIRLQVSLLPCLTRILSLCQSNS